MADFSPFLGKGAKYPFSFSEITGGVIKASSTQYTPNNPAVSGATLEKINGSLALIFSTSVGSRFFLPTFGSNLYRLVFEPNDDIFADTIRVYIADAISKWEKRIILLSVDVLTANEDLDQNTARIIVNYKVISSQVVGNLIFPFVRRI